MNFIHAGPFDSALRAPLRMTIFVETDDNFERNYVNRTVILLLLRSLRAGEQTQKSPAMCRALLLALKNYVTTSWLPSLRPS
jgi:hypothetical protein